MFFVTAGATGEAEQTGISGVFRTATAVRADESYFIRRQAVQRTLPSLLRLHLEPWRSWRPSALFPSHYRWPHSKPRTFVGNSASAFFQEVQQPSGIKVARMAYQGHPQSFQLPLYRSRCPVVVPRSQGFG